MILLYPIGFIGALLSAWAGRWIALWISFAMMAGVTLFAIFFDSLVPIGSHGSPNYMLAWGLAILVPRMIVGCFLAGLLSYLIAGATARRREAEELAALLAEDGPK